VTLSISEMARFTCSMPFACSPAEAAISAMMSVTLVTEPVISTSFPETRLLVTSPSVASETDWRMSSSVRFAACLERSASERTSSATTAKPRPASPARAASTAALRARRLVWKAISLMSLMIWEVPSAEARMRPMAPTICSMAAPPSTAASLAERASAFACWALPAACLPMEAMDSSEEEVSSMDEACCDAPSATAFDDDAIWLAAPEICSTARATCARASFSADAVPFTASLRRAWSPL